MGISGRLLRDSWKILEIFGILGDSGRIFWGILGVFKDSWMIPGDS